MGEKVKIYGRPIASRTIRIVMPCNQRDVKHVLFLVSVYDYGLNETCSEYRSTVAPTRGLDMYNRALWLGPSTSCGEQFRTRFVGKCARPTV